LPGDRARALHNEQDRERGQEMSDICLVCGENYPPNGIVMCDDCGMDKDIEQQQEREGNK
jgi:NMD protein affecting ribosome stability and mRNA decay